jgi:argonaute-like protein implicated in RNA metabolism and viral defense
MSNNQAILSRAMTVGELLDLIENLGIERDTPIVFAKDGELDGEALTATDADLARCSGTMNGELFNSGIALLRGEDDEHDDDDTDVLVIM